MLTFVGFPNHPIFPSLGLLIPKKFSTILTNPIEEKKLGLGKAPRDLDLEAALLTVGTCWLPKSSAVWKMEVPVVFDCYNVDFFKKIRKNSAT